MSRRARRFALSRASSDRPRPSAWPARSYAQINLAALRSNLAQVREYAPGTQVLAVVKANAYGHGLMRVLPALDDADGLALSSSDAAYELRERRLFTARS